MIRRGVRRRCPLCGGTRAWFTGYYRTQDRCRTCGFKWERGLAGFMTGAMTMNIIITFLLIAVTMVTLFVITFPDPPVLPLIGILVAIAIAVPLLIRPFTYTIWSSVDLMMRQPEADELLDASQHAAPGHEADLAKFAGKA